MINRLLTIAILAFLCAQSLSTLSAQVKADSHKIVIIEKEVDENGKITEQKVVKEGAEAKAYIEKMKSEGNDHNGAGAAKKIKMITEEDYEIKVKGGDGKVKVMKWNGEGEMPAEMRKIMEEEGLGNLSKDDITQSRIRIRKKEGADLEEVMDLEFDGDELPDNVKEILEQEGIELVEFTNEDGTKELRVTARKEEKAPPPMKAQLGVNISEHDKGVEVAEVQPDSAAAFGGIQAGDIITAIDGSKLTTVKELIDKIAEYKPADEVVVSLLRSDRPLSMDITLKGRIDLFPFKTWEQVMQYGKETKTIEIEIGSEVSEEKK